MYCVFRLKIATRPAETIISTTAYLRRNICQYEDLECLYDYSHIGYLTNNYQIACQSPTIVDERSLTIEEVNIEIRNPSNDETYTCPNTSIESKNKCSLKFENFMTPMILSISPQNIIFESIINMRISPSRKKINSKWVYTPLVSSLSSILVSF